MTCCGRVYAILFDPHGIAVAWLWPDLHVEHAAWFRFPPNKPQKLEAK